MVGYRNVISKCGSGRCLIQAGDVGRGEFRGCPDELFVSQWFVQEPPDTAIGRAFEKAYDDAWNFAVVILFEVCLARYGLPSWMRVINRHDLRTVSAHLLNSLDQGLRVGVVAGLTLIGIGELIDLPGMPVPTRKNAAAFERWFCQTVIHHGLLDIGQDPQIDGIGADVAHSGYSDVER